MTDAAVFLCDESGVMARPWAEAGIECWCVDVQHSIRRDRKDGNINFVWGDARSWTPPAGLNILFVAAFPPCTHVSVSGTRDHPKKRGHMLRDALETFEACRQAAAWSGAPYCIENPVGILSSIPHIGKPDFYFHPWEYAGWNENDHYTKKTCLWTGNGFVMPPKRPAAHLAHIAPDNRIHFASPSSDRGDIRSVTPAGFAVAVFEANAPERYKREAA